MSVILEVRGPEVTPNGGETPDEKYGEGVWGPAIFGNGNKTGLSDAAASTFELRESAYVLKVAICYLVPSLDMRIRELE